MPEISPYNYDCNLSSVVLSLVRNGSQSIVAIKYLKCYFVAFSIKSIFATYFSYNLFLK